MVEIAFVPIALIDVPDGDAAANSPIIEDQPAGREELYGFTYHISNREPEVGAITNRHLHDMGHPREGLLFPSVV